MYRCLFKVLSLVLSLTSFQCALPKHLNTLLNSTRIIRSWWGLLRFFSLFSTFDLVCRCFYSSFNWSWRAKLVWSPWIACPTSYSSLTRTCFIVSRTISSRSWLMVFHWCLTVTKSPASCSTSSLTPPGLSLLMRIFWPLYRGSTKLY